MTILIMTITVIIIGLILFHMNYDNNNANVYNSNNFSKIMRNITTPIVITDTVSIIIVIITLIVCCC